MRYGPHKAAAKRIVLALTPAILALALCPEATAAGLPAFTVSAGVPLLGEAASTGAVVAQGGNYSVPLPDGRTLWLLNNVWSGERKAGGQASVWGIVDGAAAFAPSTSPYAQASSLRYVSDENGWPLPLLSGEMKEYSQVRRFWPRSGLCAGGKCYVFYSIMNNFGPEPYDYFRVGQGVAWAQDPAGPYAKARLATRYSLWNDIEPAFGSAVLADEDGWVYVYGRSAVAPGEYGAELARVKPDSIASREKYSYYMQEASSAAWTSDVNEASTLLEGMPDEFSVSYNERLKSYLLVYYDEKAAVVNARLAPAPWGPWDRPSKLIGCAPEDYCYGAKEQPGFAAGGGMKIFVTVEKKNAPYLYEITFK